MSKSTNYTKQFVLATSLLGLMIAATERTEATQIINIDDRTETPFATMNGVPVTLLPDSVGEFIHFAYEIENNVVNPIFPSTFSVSRDLLEPGTLALSDRLVVTFTLDSHFVDIQFDSRDPVLLPVGQNILDPLVEDGSFQLMGGYTFLNTDTGQTAGADFFVASDVDVPEPSTILLMVMGFAALAGTQIHRRVGQCLEFAA